MKWFNGGPRIGGAVAGGLLLPFLVVKEEVDKEDEQLVLPC
jgi:hypothetical protein